ncbi:MAG TPA: peptidase U32 family protein [Alphaproteobacteria bacterium]|nr:peptidase U32 family protein [Alphaproteobacteria bacterium]
MNALELVAPAGTPAALRAALDAGADAVYLGFRDETNARNFPGLNFSAEELEESIALAHGRGRKVLVAVNTFPGAGNSGPWRRAIDTAAALRADGVILADIGLLDYAARVHPDLPRHLSVQASAANAEAIRFYHDAFAIRRVVLPRVLTIEEVARVTAEVPCGTEVFAFGGLCVMAEGRCALSSYAAGRSPNKDGVCSPPSRVRYEKNGGTVVARLGEFVIDVFEPGQPAGYPTLCKGRFQVCGRQMYLFEEPTSLNVLALLPELVAAGVRAIKIEGRQRGRAYVAEVVGAFRRAIDAVARGERFQENVLAAMTEGARGTIGALDKKWQ